jgi:hypothetical protein
VAVEVTAVVAVAEAVAPVAAAVVAADKMLNNSVNTVHTSQRVLTK